MDTTMQQIAAAAGLGTLALEFIGSHPGRLAEFRIWTEERAGKTWPPGAEPTAAVVKAAALACAGLNQAFKDAA